MHLKNNYWYFDSVIPKDTCEEIIRLGKEKIERQKSLGYHVEGITYGNTEKGQNKDATPQGANFLKKLKGKKVYNRDSTVTWFEDQWLYDLITPYIKLANVNAGWNFDVDWSETFQFTSYDKNGFYSWHDDGGSDSLSAYKRYIYGVTPEPLGIVLDSSGRRNLPSGYTRNNSLVGKVRKISMTLNLTDPNAYEGGDLMFNFGASSECEPFTCKEARNQGTIIVFPSFVNHCVSPVKKGMRYSLVLWTLGPPFK
jgi:hypothetical protein